MECSLEPKPVPDRADLVLLARGGHARPIQNAISRRFQNQRADAQRDPLAHFELDPLRPLNTSSGVTSRMNTSA
jgi:hypothetical protein